MPEESLYQDEQLKIDYYKPSPEDHLIWIKDNTGKETAYILQRGILEELARTPRGGIERKINTVNDMILFHLKKEGISVDGLHVAICQAYAAEEEQIREFTKTLNAQ